MSSKTFDNTKINVEFDEDYQSRININSGENISSLFAKIRRFILDLKAVCFSGSYNDLSDVPDVVTKEYVDPVKSQAAINRTTLGYQCKNLLPYSKSIVKGGITFTCDENGYMTASNTAGDARQWAAYNSQYNVKLKPGKYILSFVSASVCTNAYGNIMALSANDKKIVDIGQTNYYNKTSGAIEFTIDTEQTVYIMSKIFDGKTAIMLRYADITDDTYEPYQPSLQEQIIALEERIAALGG